MDSIKGAIMDTINPGIEKFVAPHMSKIIDIIAYPVCSCLTLLPRHCLMRSRIEQFRDGYAEVIKAFNTKVDAAITAGIGSGQDKEVRCPHMCPLSVV